MTTKSTLDSAIEQSASSSKETAKPKDSANILGAKKSAPSPIQWGEMWSFDADNPSRPTSADYGDLKEFAVGKPGKGEAEATEGHFAHGWDSSRAPMTVYPLSEARKAEALAARDQWLATLPDADAAFMRKVIGKHTPQFGIAAGNRRFRALPYAYIERMKGGLPIDDLQPVAVRLLTPLSRTDLEIFNFSDNLQPTPGARRPTSIAQLRQSVKWYQDGVSESRLRVVYGAFRGQQMMAIARIIVQGPRSGAPWKDAEDFLRRIALDRKDPEYIDTTAMMAGKNKEDLRKASAALEPGKKKRGKDALTKAQAIETVKTVIVEGKDAVAQRGLSKAEWAQLAARNPESLFYSFCYAFVCAPVNDRERFTSFIGEYADELNAIFIEAKDLMKTDDDDDDDDDADND